MMIKKTTMALCLGLGATAAFITAPLFHMHADPSTQIRPMWAHEYRTLGEMTVDADAVVVATVARNRLGRVVATAGGTSQLPFTLVDMVVEAVVAGEAAPTITIEQTGGDLGGSAIFVDDDGGAYRPGDQVLLFLKKQPESEYYYVSHPKGRFAVQGGTLVATRPDDPVGRSLDRLSLTEAAQLILKNG